VTHKEAKQAETVSVEADMGNITHSRGMHQDLPKEARLDHTRWAAASS